MKICIFLLIISAVVWSCNCARILAVFPIPSHSHFTIVFRIAKELADRGHQVTAINPYPQKTPIKNYRDVPVEEIIEYVEILKKKLFTIGKQGILGSINTMFDMGIGVTTRLANLNQIQTLLNSKNETFDVVLIESFLSDAQVGFAHHFKAPLVLIAPTPSTVLNNYILANPGPSSYVPNVLGTFTKKMNFWQRLSNLFFTVGCNLVREISYMPEHRKIFNKYFKAQDSNIQMDDVLQNASLLLTNSHPSVTDAVPHVPNIIEIGGYHIGPPKKLPEDLQRFLDSAKEGVVLFSMGSNLKSKDLSIDTRTAILKAFAQIKQQVLWKFEIDLPDLPKNVKIMNWLPQQDILAHPNVRVFITHGGLLGNLETVYFGVPVIGIPVFSDQKHNVANVVENGYGLHLPLDQLNEERLLNALKEILGNPKYRKEAQKRSKVMRDQPLKPMDTAIFWIEHVIRNKGAQYFKPAGLNLKWYQREMIDIFVFLGVTLAALSFATYLFVKCVIVKLLKSIRNAFYAAPSTKTKSKKTN